MNKLTLPIVILTIAIITTGCTTKETVVKVIEKPLPVKKEIIIDGCHKYISVPAWYGNYCNSCSCY